MSQKQSKPPSKKAGPKTLEGSAEAKKIAAVILEVLAGLRATPDACNALEISVNRYYVLETRALQGLISALEPLRGAVERRPRTGSVSSNARPSCYDVS